MKKEKPLRIDSDTDPVVMCMDFLLNPTFVPGRSLPSEHDGKFFVNGRLATTVLGGVLDSDAADVFHALTHLAKQQGFPPKINFVMLDLLKQMKWSSKGENYDRIRSAIEALYAISIEIELVNKKLGGSGGWRILQERFLFEKGMSDHRIPSWIKFSDRMLEMFRTGSLKAVHPVYFELDEPIDKRIFSLLSVRASDTKEWRVGVLTLRDLIPLLANKVKTPSGAAQQIEKNLKRLQKKGIIKKFEFSKPKGSKELFVELELDPEYFFSSNAGKRKFLNGRTQDARKIKNEAEKQEITPAMEVLIAKLLEKGVESSAASSLVQAENETVILTQIAHLEYLEKNGKAPDAPAGFLIEAIRKGYKPPEIMIKKAAEEKNVKINRLIDEAQNNARHKKDPKRLEGALLALSKARQMGASSHRLDKIEQETQHDLKCLTDNDYVLDIEREQKKASELLKTFREQEEKSRRSKKIEGLIDEAKKILSGGEKLETLVLAAETLEKAEKSGAHPAQLEKVSRLIKKKLLKIQSAALHQTL